MKLWCLDDRDRIYTDACPRDVSCFREVKCFRGKSMSGTFPADATIDIRTRRPPADHFRTGVLWIVSAKLKRILDSFEVQAEYFTVNVLDRHGLSVDMPFYCVNFTRILDWFDRSKSRYAPEQDFATQIETLVARPEMLSDVPLAVAEKTIPVLVGVSDLLAGAIVASGCSGIVFREPSEWRDPRRPVSRT